MDQSQSHVEKVPSTMAQSQSTADQPQHILNEPLPAIDRRESSIMAMSDPSSWINSLYFNPCNNVRYCLCGIFCGPCLYGNTQTRLRNLQMGEDNDTDPSLCNTPCWVYGLSGCCVLHFLPPFACIIPWICAFTQTNRIRETYNIEGSLVSDLAKSCCCRACNLVQANREVQSRAALDKKNARNGIYPYPYNTNNQQMRYISPDMLFGDSIGKPKSEHERSEAAYNNATTRRDNPAASDDDTAAQNNPSAILSLDGATIVEAIELKDLKGKMTCKHPAKAIQAAITARKVSQNKAENTPPSKRKNVFGENRGIEVKNSSKVANQKHLASSHAGTCDQKGGGSENTIVHTDELDSNNILRGEQVDRSVNGGNDETVFVYYNSPTTPEPQKLRDCVKTNTSESTNDFKVNHAKKDARSSIRGSNSYSADERLSFEEPSIRGSIQAMLSIDKVLAASSAALTPAEYKQPAQLPSIIESSQSGSNPNGSEETIKDVRKPTSGLSQPTVIHIETGNNGNDQEDIVALHPLTRDSIIRPSTPLALEEVKEEINVNGEWKVPQEGKAGAMTVGWKYGRKVRPSFFDGNSEP